METRVRTPHDIFFAPQQLLVPLFQRPYVWSQEGQWEPLWEDVQRQAERLLETGKPGSAHFLGAVVLQHQDGAGGGDAPLDDHRRPAAAHKLATALGRCASGL